MRWNRSRWVPIGVGDRGLDRVGVATRRRSSRPGARREPVDGADDAGLHLGERLAAGEAEPARVALHGASTRAACRAPSARAPVHSPKSHSSRPSVDAHAGARAPWRWAPRSPGCARAARRTRRRPSSARAIRAAAASAWLGPSSARCRPGARPGSVVPVVGVWPWRTSSTRVGCGGGLGSVVGHRQARPTGLASAPIVQPVGSTVCAGQRGCSDGRAAPIAWTRRPCRGIVPAGLPAPGRVAGAGGREKRAAFRDEDYWGRPVPGFGDPDARSSCSSAWPRPPTAPTAPGGCSPATARATGCTAPCTAPASPTSRPATRRDDGLVLTGAYITAPVRCAPPANKPTPDERDRCRPFLERELALLDERAGVRRASGQFAYQVVRRRRSACGPGPASATASRSPLGRRAADDRLLVPPEPAEHLHRHAHRADARRRVRAGARPSRPPQLSVHAVAFQRDRCDNARRCDPHNERQTQRPNWSFETFRASIEMKVRPLLSK